MPSFTESYNAHKIVRSFLYVQRTGKHDEQNILNIALTLFPFQHKVPIKMFVNYGAL